VEAEVSCDQVTPESLESHKSVDPDTTSWYCPVEEVANLRGLVRPDLAVNQEEAA
jgi:hypothetical protein